MKANIMDRNEVFAELTEITQAICEGRANEAQKNRLKQLVLNDEEAKRFYLDLMDKQMVNEDEEFESSLSRLLVDKNRLTSKEKQAPITQVLRKSDELMNEAKIKKKKLNISLICLVVLLIVLSAFAIIYLLR